MGDKPPVQFSVYMRSATRRRALRLRGLESTSDLEGLITRRETSRIEGSCSQVHTGVPGGQMH